MNMELEGTFDTFPLSELLEMLQHSSMCGVLEIQGLQGPAAVWTRDGVICHAEYVDLRGKFAILRLLNEPNRPFKVRADNMHPWGPPGLGDVQHLIKEAEEYQKTWGEIYKRLPDLDVVPIVQQKPTAQLKLTDLDWAVMMAIDGEHTVRQLTEPTMLDLLDVCRAVIRLRHMGVVALTEKRTHADRAASEQQTMSMEPPDRDGLIKRTPRIDG